MPANKYALLRYRIIDKCLRNKYKPFPNKEDLRQACEDALYNSSGEHISESTIDKDLYAMRNDLTLGFEAPIKYSKLDKGYYYENPDYSIENIPLNEDDVEAILLAVGTLEQFKANPIFNQFGDAIDKLIDRVNLSPTLTDDKVLQIVQFESTPKASGSEWLEILFEAIKDHIQIEVKYKKFQTDEERNYLLDPYLLKEYRGRWYLIAWHEKRGHFITLGLDRIVRAYKSDKVFVPSESFKPEIFFEHSIGISAPNDGKPEDIIFKANPVLSKYLNSQPIHHSQSVVEEGPQGSIFKIRVVQTYELVQLFLGYGDEVEVLEPRSLIAQLVETMYKANSKYK